MVRLIDAEDRLAFHAAERRRLSPRHSEGAACLAIRARGVVRTREHVSRADVPKDEPPAGPEVHTA